MHEERPIAAFGDRPRHDVAQSVRGRVADLRAGVAVDLNSIASEDTRQLVAASTVRAVELWKRVLQQRVLAKRHVVGPEVLPLVEAPRGTRAIEEPEESERLSDEIRRIDEGFASDDLHLRIFERRDEAG